ncbi:hypothetical protein GIB67_033253 [Kingdonia uniflora]|uniref:Uncharacterized protein n=1 Tax=Kingdonia uniflora TaxID=39325 RepID=A0A7J7MPL9_9MAGN|nr:hypothetical protein GIB67_033253 [Kingdonia uniflora]
MSQPPRWTLTENSSTRLRLSRQLDQSHGEPLSPSSLHGVSSPSHFHRISSNPPLAFSTIFFSHIFYFIFDGVSKSFVTTKTVHRTQIGEHYLKLLSHHLI